MSRATRITEGGAHHARQAALLADIQRLVARLDTQIQRSRPARVQRRLLIGSSVLAVVTVLTVASLAIRSRFAES
jgi:hypothetical protein